MKKVSINEVRDAYKDASKETTNQRHNIVEGGLDKLGQAVEIFTDGSVKGVENGIDGRSFAGWGWVKKHKNLNGHVHKSYRYGGMQNASAMEAEFTAMKQALENVQYKSNVTIFTDSFNTIAKLKNREKLENDIASFSARIEKVGAKNIPSEDWVKNNESRFALGILDTIKNNENILSVDCEWVRSHTLDSIEADAIDFDSCSTLDDYSLANKVTGNHEADYIANKGAVKAIASSLLYLNNDYEGTERDRNIGIGRLKKNFNNSFFTKGTILGYFARNGMSRYDSNLLLDTFGMDFMRTAAKARDHYSRGRMTKFNNFMELNGGNLSSKYRQQLNLNEADRPQVQMVNVTQLSKEERQERLNKFHNKFGGFGLTR